MRSTRPAYFTIVSLLLTLLTINITVRAADDDDTDEYDVKARVMRITFIAGQVKLERSDSKETESARVNFPLVEGDVLSTDRDGRVEIQIDARNFLRLGGDSVLQITTLRDEGIALSLNQGTASIRLAKFDRDHEYFEIDAPKTTLAAEKEGRYRLDASSDGRVRLTARNGGRARIYSETSGFVLRDGRTAELVTDGPDAGDWEFTTAIADSWDTWVDDRERYLAERMRYDVQYYDNYLWGAEDLDAYGSWSYTDDYGWVWRPNPTVISGYDNWAPYRYGNWTWIAPYGWTWVGYEPWGWAPYHYGRWVYNNNYWAWCPRSQFYRHRSWWRPALVAFVVNISFGDNYCWYPLHYHQRDPHSRNYEARNRRHNRHDNDWNDFRRHNPADHRAVSYIPRREWGNDRGHLRAADDTLARRVVAIGPSTTDLPGRRAGGGHTVVREPSGDGDSATGRGTRPADFGARQTGAGTRHPGVPLDNELRQSRIFNGRGAQPDFPVTSAGAGPVVTRPTGAVTRPVRQPRGLDPREDAGRDANRDSDATDHPVNGNGSPRNDVHTRAPRGADPREDSGRDANRDSDATDHPVNGNGTPRNDVHTRAPRGVDPREDSGRDANRDSDATDRPVTNGNVVPRNDPPETHERTDRPTPPDNSDRNQGRRIENSPPRQAPVERRRDPPRYDPPPRNDPPRNDPPARSDPPPRNDPPARSDPPPRNDPPPQRSESREDRAPAKVKDPR